MFVPVGEAVDEAVRVGEKLGDGVIVGEGVRVGMRLISVVVEVGNLSACEAGRSLSRNPINWSGSWHASEAVMQIQARACEWDPSLILPL